MFVKDNLFHEGCRIKRPLLIGGSFFVSEENEIIVLILVSIYSYLSKIPFSFQPVIVLAAFYITFLSRITTINMTISLILSCDKQLAKNRELAVY
jgi:hypothetical protein